SHRRLSLSGERGCDTISSNVALLRAEQTIEKAALLAPPARHVEARFSPSLVLASSPERE
ncbi:MAG TPA: hypothetical protein VFQ06_13720, partial [Nitrospira sp.]|nr:hypothetical protein [Nitrospira sp.]